MSLMVSNQISPNAFSVTPYFSSSMLNSKLITYPVTASSVTYGIDQWVDQWEEDKYLPCTGIPGKILDFVTGWTLDDKGNPNPSIIGRIKNLFAASKNKEIIKKADDVEEEQDQATYIPEGSVTYYNDHDHNDSTAGTFGVSYWQEGCDAPSFIKGNWELTTKNIPIPDKLSRCSSFNPDFHNCLITSMLNDYLQSVSEFCNSSTVCGCPQDEKLFSYIFLKDQSSLRIFNNETILTQVALPDQSYPFPDVKLIDQCYVDTIQTQFDDLHHNNVVLYSSLGAVIGIGIIICIDLLSDLVALKKRN